ncbi:hypothetical protein B7P43_G16019 [Cryptotermes secundus]|uniref:Uncharacterized protein n=1 Tax=Cryptotermes secundus TaxID=105785 RepID=A0A2J7R995_9NEOP|nr:hypothetical protein B7P43_G16019 [Cryptotermes secundus]
MSKVFKVRSIPKIVEEMGSVETETEMFSEEWLKIDTFKDWLERVPGDQYKARCSVCNIVLDCSISQLSKHAACSGHQTTIQNSRKRKAVIGQLIGKVRMASSSGSSGQPRKIILLRRNIEPSVKCEVVNEAVGEDSEGDTGVTMISSSPAFEKAVHLSEIQLAQQRKRKSFRLEWLDIPEFKDWLSPDPDSPYKARCLACNTVLNAGKSELEKHATGAKHEKAVEALKRMVLEQQEWDEANEMDEDEDAEDMYEPSMNMGTQTMITGERLEQNRQLEALNRIASSVDSLATSVASAFESLTRHQETMNNILMQLVSK